MKNPNKLESLIEVFQSYAPSELSLNHEAISKAYENNRYEQSLTLKVLSIFGGLLASITFLGFLVLLGFNDSGATLLTLGIFAIVGAILVNKNYSEILLDTISVSTFIIGFLLVGYGLHLLKVDENIICITYIIISLCTVVVLQNYLLSFFSTLIVHGSILTLIIKNNAAASIHIFTLVLSSATTYLFMNEGKIITFNKAFNNLYRPIKAAFVLSLLLLLACYTEKILPPEAHRLQWQCSVVFFINILLVVRIMLAKLSFTKLFQKVVAYGICLVALVPTVLAPAIAGSLLVLLLSFLVSYRTAFVLSIMSFLYAMSRFYYDLHYTLLTKSLLMFGTGISFLIAYWFIVKKLSTNEKQ